MRIDAHQHFWRYSPREYSWIDDSMRAIRRDFLPADLTPALAAAQLDGSVVVQARQSLDETDWLLSLAGSSPRVKGVVGWLPLAQEGANIGRMLDCYHGQTRLKGVRHVLQAEPDAYFSNSGFNAALLEVARRSLSYDLLVYARQLPAALAWIDQHPDLRVVVDHIAKPVIDGVPQPEWRAQMRELARRPNVFCKFSGVVTEAPRWQWSVEQIRPYFETVLDAFSAQRLMFGSDWPVCLVAADYARWVSAVESLVQPLSPAERDAIMGGSATAFYQLAP